ncbi:MAG: ATP-dependent nuclease [Fusobacteriaceae bacterium]
MKLKWIKIENWKSIKYTHLSLDNFLILIGANNSGKSALNSALNFLLKPDENINYSSLEQVPPLRIEGIFETQNKSVVELKIFKYDKNSPFVYMKNDLSLTLEEYKNFLEPVNLFHVVADLDFNSKILGLFLKKLKMRFSDFKVTESYEEFNDTYVSRGLFRNLLFENIRNFLKYTEEKEMKNIENIYILFEHPEMFLNPQEQKELYNCLVKLSKLGIFISIETHSSRFVGLKQYKAICMAKNSLGRSSFFQYRGNLFSGDEVKNFNMNYWINGDRGELFFSKKVILVEGQTDKILLGYLAENLGVFRYDYCIIECGSKSILPQFSKLLNSFRINYLVVYDKDNHTWRTKEELENSNVKNKQIQRGIDYEFGNYLEFSNDIEEEIYNHKRERKNYKNKPFIALQHVMSEDYNIPEKLKEKIIKIYEN